MYYDLTRIEGLCPEKKFVCAIILMAIGDYKYLCDAGYVRNLQPTQPKLDDIKFRQSFKYNHQITELLNFFNEDLEELIHLSCLNIDPDVVLDSLRAYPERSRNNFKETALQIL